MNLPDDKPIIYLDAVDLIDINEAVTGDSVWIRDVPLLESALRRPAIVVFGVPQFPTLLDKAAALMHSLAYHHLFMDGNKRTAVEAVRRFLSLNGQRFDYDAARDASYILEIAQGQHDVEAIAVWLAEHVTPA